MVLGTSIVHLPILDFQLEFALMSPLKRILTGSVPCMLPQLQTGDCDVSLAALLPQILV